MVGTAARIVSSRERAAGAGVASGADGAGLRVGSDGLGVGAGSGTERATGGVSGTSGISTSASGSTGSTSRALSRCSRLRVSTDLGTCLASACSVFLRIERVRMGSQPVGGSRSSSLPGPDFCGAFAGDFRTPRSRAARSVIRSPGPARPPRTRLRLPATGAKHAGPAPSPGVLGRSVCSPFSAVCCSLWCASQRPRTGRSTRPLGAGGRQPYQKGRLGDTRPRVAALPKVVRGACNCVRPTRCDLYVAGETEVTLTTTRAHRVPDADKCCVLPP